MHTTTSDDVQARLRPSLKHLLDSLLTARRTGLRFDVTDDMRPESLTDAYVVADGLTAALGGPIAGFKVGASSTRAQGFLKLDAPFWGAIRAMEIHRASAVLDPDRAPYDLEAELAFSIARDLGAEERFTAETIPAALSACCPAIEINRPSYTKPFEAGGLAIIADKGVNYGLVLGPPITDWHARDLDGFPLEFTGADGATGVSTAQESGFSPLAMVAWAANALAEIGRPLRAGVWVTTGLIGRPLTLAAGSGAELRIDGQPLVRASVKGA